MGATADDRVFYKLDEEMRGYYCEIGKKFYQDNKHADISGLDEEYRRLFGEVSKLDDKKNNMEAKQLALQGKRRCPECRVLLPIESRFCNMCGVKLPDLNKEEPPKEEEAAEAVAMEANVEAKKCIFCGSPMESDAVFCPNCGQKND